LARWQEI